MDGIKQEYVRGLPPEGLTNPGLTSRTLGMGMGTLGVETLEFLVSTQRHVCTQK